MKQREGLAFFILVRILPPLVLLMGLLFWGAIDHLRRDALAHEKERLAFLAHQVKDICTIRLENVAAQARFLAENDLIMGGMVDARQRRETLPVFFQSLTAAGLERRNPGAVCLLDFRGRVIASNGSAQDAPDIRSWIDDPDGAPEMVRVDENGFSLYRVVLLNGSREGAVLVRLAPAELGALLNLDQWPESVSVELAHGGLVMSNRVHLDDDFQVGSRLEELESPWLCTVRVAADVRQIDAFVRTARLLLSAIGVAVLLGISVLIGGVVWIATRPVRSSVEAMSRIVDHGDLGQRLPPRGTKEIRSLARAFNGVMERLSATTESQERFSLMVNGTSDGMWDWDLRSNELFLSARWKEILGYEDHELPSRFESFEDNVHPDDRPAVLEHVDRYLKGELPEYSIEFRMRCKDGSYQWVHARGQAIRDKDGRPIRMAGSHTDITERKRWETELARAAENQRILLDNIQTQVWYLTDAQTYGAVNRAHAVFNGARPEDIAFRSLADLFPAEVADECQKSNGAVFSTGRPVFTEEWVPDSTGEPRLLAIHKSPKLDADGNVEYVVCSGEDITERKQAELDLAQSKEELERANRALQESVAHAREMAEKAEAASLAKSQFLANMSHEIRTPMNGVMGMTGLLLDTALNDEQQHYAQVVRSSATSLLSVINDILDFSKIEANRLELEDLDFDLRTAMGEFADLLAVRAHEKGLEFICCVAPDVPVLLRGDPGRLRQILVNVAGNAIKFTEAGEVVVSVALDEDAGETVVLRFSVRDTGIGIAHDKLSLLFDAFQQVDASMTRRFGGTGLGLAISKRLAQMMGGEMGVTSEEGKGSTFWFTVRVLLQEGVTKKEPPRMACLRGTHMLIVDDNETNRDVLGLVLASWHVRYEAAQCADDARSSIEAAVARGDPFDLAIIDMQMPVTDGATLGQWIRRHPAVGRLPMVMMTSVGQRGDAAKFRQAGFNAYLPKPVKMDDLYGCLATVLGDAGKPDHAEGASKPFVTRHSIRENKRSRHRILLAEDNIVNQQVAVMTLGKMGYRVEAVADGGEAVKAVEEGRFDLVLMDVHMPTMDGYEATAAIRAAEAGSSRRLPIIAMTANAMKGDKERCIEKGMDDYVSKPFEPEQLVRVLKRWLPGRSDVISAPVGQVPAKAPNTRDGDKPPRWDRAALLGRLLGDENVLADILQTVVTDLPRQVARLKESLEAGNAVLLEEHAHGIKGTSANLSAEGLRDAAERLEAAARRGAFRAARGLLPDLEREVALLLQAIGEV